MKNYTVWKKEDSDDIIIVEVHNECDLHSVKKEFLDKGYIIDVPVYIGDNIGFVAYTEKYLDKILDKAIFIDLEEK